jgi:NDP-sugar pyrophosphorylase family protein
LLFNDSDQIALGALVVELARNFCNNDPFILSYGDILVDPSSYIPLTRPMDAEILITVRRTDELTQGGAVYLNDAFELVDLREKPLPGRVNTPGTMPASTLSRAPFFPTLLVSKNHREGNMS